MNSLGTMLPSVNKECPLLLQFLPGREVQLKKKKLFTDLRSCWLEGTFQEALVQPAAQSQPVSTAGYGQLWLFSLKTGLDEGSSAFPTACLSGENSLSAVPPKLLNYNLLWLLSYHHVTWD